MTDYPDETVRKESGMAKVIKFVGNKTTDKDGFPVFRKVIDGEVFWCVDIDALSEFEKRRYFELKGGR